MSTVPDTIVLVHGLWMTPRSWEEWVPYYEAKGYKVLTPAYPGFEIEVEALRVNPSVIAELADADVVVSPRRDDRQARATADHHRPLVRRNPHTTAPRSWLRRCRRHDRLLRRRRAST